MQASKLEEILIEGSEVALRVCISNNLLEDAVGLRITAKLQRVTIFLYFSLEVLLGPKQHSAVQNPTGKGQKSL